MRGDSEKTVLETEMDSFMKEVRRCTASLEKRLDRVAVGFCIAQPFLLLGLVLFGVSFYILMQEQGFSATALLALSGFMLAIGGVVISVMSLVYGVVGIKTSLDLTRLSMGMSVALSAVGLMKEKEKAKKKGQSPKGRS